MAPRILGKSVAGPPVVFINCLSAVSGGAVSYLRNLLPPLHERFSREQGPSRVRILAHEEQIPLLNPIDAASILVVRGARIAGYRRLVWEWQTLERFVRSVGADVLFHPYQVGAMPKGIRNILMLRNMEPFRFRQFRYPLRSWLRNALLRVQSGRCLRSANRVIAVSKYAEQCAIEEAGVAPSRVRRIYHGRDETFQPLSDNSQDAATLARFGLSGPFLLTPGALLPYRRCEDVIRGFGRVSGRLPGFCLFVAGEPHLPGYFKHLQAVARESGVDDRVRFLGHVSREEMQALYRGCAACVIASEVEACPNIAIEALSSGCIIVRGDRPPLDEMLRAASVTFRARDVAHLAQQIEHAVFDDELRTQLRRSSVERARQYSWERCAKETYAALTEW